MTEKTKQSYVAMKWQEDYEAVLHPTARNRLADIEAALASQYEKHKSKTTEMSACLDKYMAALLQFYRITLHHDNFIAYVHANSANFTKQGGFLALRGAEAIYDFESLLIQSRATLDRLTFFICENKTDKPRSLINILKEDKWPQYKILLPIFQQGFSDAIFSDVLIKERSGNDERSLRSLITHRASGMEVLDNCFEAYVSTQMQALLFDCVISDKYPGLSVFEGSRHLMLNLTYLVLNTLAVYVDLPVDEDLGNQIAWENRFIRWKDYEISEDEKGLVLPLFTMHPSGFNQQNRFVSADILDTSFKL